MRPSLARWSLPLGALALALAGPAWPSDPDVDGLGEDRLAVVAEWSIDLATGARQGSAPLEVLHDGDGDGDGAREAVVKVDLTDRKGLRVRATLGGPPKGFALHLADSATNNGWAGDAATQSRDAEAHLVDDGLFAFGCDGTPKEASLDGGLLLVRQAALARQGDELQLLARDGALAWRADGKRRGRLASPFLFALAGQADAEGPVNRHLFVAANRTVGSAARSGSGVTLLVLQLLD